MQIGKVAKYVTDFADDVVLGVDNVIVLPHLGLQLLKVKIIVQLWQLMNLLIILKTEISKKQCKLP